MDPDAVSGAVRVTGLNRCALGSTGILHITWKEVWLQNEKQCFKMPIELFLMGMSTIL